jgi:superfamily II DNA helicase RecQ
LKRPSPSASRGRIRGRAGVEKRRAEASLGWLLGDVERDKKTRKKKKKQKKKKKKKKKEKKKEKKKKECRGQRTYKNEQNEQYSAVIHSLFFCMYDLLNVFCFGMAEDSGPSEN